MHGVYRAISLALLLVLVAAVASTLGQLELDSRTRIVLTGVVIGSAYPMRYLLAAPGMLADALFLVGLTLAALLVSPARVIVTSMCWSPSPTGYDEALN